MFPRMKSKTVRYLDRKTSRRWPQWSLQQPAHAGINDWLDLHVAHAGAGSRKCALHCKHAVQKAGTQHESYTSCRLCILLMQPAGDAPVAVADGGCGQAEEQHVQATGQVTPRHVAPFRQAEPERLQHLGSGIISWVCLAWLPGEV